MDRAFGQAGPAAAPRLGGLALGIAVGLRFLKAHKGGVAKNGDDDAMTRLLHVVPAGQSLRRITIGFEPSSQKR